MRTLIAVAVGIVCQVLAQTCLDATPAEGFITYLVGATFGYLIGKKEGAN